MWEFDVCDDTAGQYRWGGSYRWRATGSNRQTLAVSGESFSSGNAAAESAVNVKLNARAGALPERGDRSGA